MTDELINDPEEASSQSDASRKEERVLSSSSLLWGVEGANFIRFWVSFILILGFIGFLGFLLCLQIEHIHHYIDQFTDNKFQSNKYVSEAFLMNILILGYGSCAGLVFTLFRLIKALSSLKANIS
jgi:hypothetical protein